MCVCRQNVWQKLWENMFGYVCVRVPISLQNVSVTVLITRSKVSHDSCWNVCYSAIQFPESVFQGPPQKKLSHEDLLTLW